MKEGRLLVTYIDGKLKREFALADDKSLRQWLSSFDTEMTFNDVVRELGRDPMVAVPPRNHSGVYFLRRVPGDSNPVDRGYLRRIRIPASSLSYDEAKDYFSLIGCAPCPSAEETKREFEKHLRSLPGGASADTKPTPTTTKPKEDTMFDNMFNGICGRIKPGNCRLSYTGGVAIRTADGTYKTYNLKTGQLTNCDRFVFDVGDDLFMMVPTRKLKRGDIVLFGGQPKCVIEVLDNKHVKVINYNTAVIEEVLPERHVFMGRKFYGKIVSLMGNGLLSGGKGGMFKNLLKFKMMSSMLGGRTDGFGDVGAALPMMFMMGGGSFDGMFDFDAGEDDKDDDDDEGFLGGLFGKDDDEKPEAEKKEEA